MSSVPTWEPTRLTAGDRWLWERQDLTRDYPASGSWVLSYALVSPDRQITLTASANGDYHRIDVAASTTADYPAGTYSWQAYVTNDTDRRTINTGTVEIKPDLAAAIHGKDTRSFARQRLAILEKALLARDPAIASYAVSTGSGSRSVNFATLADVRVEYDRVRLQVAREDEDASVRRGRGRLSRYVVRFARD